LLVDDHEPNLEALVAVLDCPNYELVKASSGPEALVKLVTHDIAVVLLDVMMPEMDGFECARRMRLRRETMMTPILFQTAVAFDPVDVLKGYEAGAVDYLIKPIEPSVVRAKVAFFVEMYEGGRALRAQIDAMRAACHALERETVAQARDARVHADELRDFISRCERRVGELRLASSSLSAGDIAKIDALATEILGQFS
jgi:PleD family two-component response regulator